MRLTEGFTAPLCDVLRIPRGLTALVGGGGKSSLMERLARELAPRGRVLVGTTTHIFPPPGMPLLLEPDAAAVEAAFSAHPGEALCVGAREAATGKLTACGLSAARLLELADYVLLEADGAKRLPLKAPAPHERSSRRRRRWWSRSPGSTASAGRCGRRCSAMNGTPRCWAVRRMIP